MKYSSKWTNILRKPFPIQIVLLLITTVLFTVLLAVSLNFPFNILVRFFPRSMMVFFFQGLLSWRSRLLIWNLIYFMYHYVKKARNEERQKMQKEKDLLELEAKALRARMNPHFIFNCLNSIKALIQCKSKR